MRLRAFACSMADFFVPPQPAATPLTPEKFREFVN
jgi:hypothetical protein